MNVNSHSSKTSHRFAESWARTRTSQKRALVDRSRNNGQVQRKTTRQIDISKTDAPSKATASITQPSKGHRKFESKEMLTTKQCFVMVSPMEVSLHPTQALSLNLSGHCGDVFSSCPEIPKGVVDIDAQVDETAPCIYSKDIMRYWRALEIGHTMDDGFLAKSPDVTPRMRSVLMDWLLQVQSHEDLLDETMHLCRVMIDRVLATSGVTMPFLQLVGITCLLIASKFCERFCTEIKTLCYLTDHTYNEDEVKKYERGVLTMLDWDISRPVCTHFLDRFLQVHQHPEKVTHMSMYLLDLSLTNVKLACVLPSKLAAAALLQARRLLVVAVEPDEDAPIVLGRTGSSGDAPGVASLWSRALEFYTGYSESDLQGALREFDTMLIKAPTSKFQGARNKYSSSSKCSISLDPRINPCLVPVQDPDGSVLV
ncbi:G2/mitotic-specific cyclin-B2 [Elysia marginata]|uniref:G2/mitotic-specific cyclin-B2 n=1 Tax=Elysia marginata TaxID=1093978 RepID=A0AAV4JZ28_9GAST|nr:G2/mitotic-specific cyclin-B2 [Elysia marginata]